MKTLVATIILLTSTGAVMAQTTYVQPQPGGGYYIPPRIGSGEVGGTYINPTPGGGYYVPPRLGSGEVGGTYINPSPGGGYTIQRPIGSDDY
jgi:hypothetical protein